MSQDAEHSPRGAARLQARPGWRTPRRIRWAAALGIWALAAGVPGADAAAETAPRTSRLDAQLRSAIEAPIAPGGLPIAVALRGDDLPPRGAARAAAIRVRQGRVLDALPAGTFALGRRYGEIPGLAGWAQRPAIEALAAHAEVALVYLDGRVERVLAQGVPLVGGATVHASGYRGSGVTVAVIDGGIDAAHPDLSDDLVAEQCFCDDSPVPNVGCCPNGKPSQSGPGAAAETDGHGTSVAGVVTSGGVVAAPGIAPDAGIAAIRVFGADGSGGRFSDIDAGLDWVLANRAALGIRVVNLSLADATEYASSAVAPCSGSNTASAVAELSEVGVAVFAASGNAGFDAGIAFPACIAQVISVGGVYDANVGPVTWCADASCSATLCVDSLTAADVFACHANSGAILDLVAPEWRTSAPAEGGGTHSFGGTSAASPYAAGEAALLLEALPGLDPETLAAAMKAHGPLVVNPGNGLAFRRTDVAAALGALLPAPPIPASGPALQLLAAALVVAAARASLRRRRCPAPPGPTGGASDRRQR